MKKVKRKKLIRKVSGGSSSAGGIISIPKDFIGRYVEINFFTEEEERQIIQKQIEEELEIARKKTELEKLHKELKKLREERKNPK